MATSWFARELEQEKFTRSFTARSQASRPKNPAHRHRLSTLKIER